MSSEKFCLKWNDFQQNIVNTFKDLRSDSDFSDVTLVLDEDHQIESHKLVLNACSPFFKNLLKTHKHPHPMIYMRGLKAKDLVAIMDFIYYGEANINQEDLDVFLNLAEEFQLKGLTGTQGNSNDTAEKLEEKHLMYKKNKTFKKEKVMYEPKTKDSSADSHELYPSTNSVVAVASSNMLATMDSDMDELRMKIESMAERRDDGEFKWKCTVCGKATKLKGDIRRHIETHVEGVSHSCNQCGKVSRSSNALIMHVSTYHRH